MIKKLTETNREQCMDFVKVKPAENLFIIGDIEAYGFDEDFQDVWGDFDDDGNLQAVLLRYRENYIVYAPGEFDSRGIARVIETENRQNMFVSGISTITKKVIEQMEEKPKKTREFFYAKCEDLKELNTPNVEVKKADVKDVPRIIELHDQTPEFEPRDGREESMTRNLKEGIARAYYVEDGEKMVSVAMTTAENSMSAMIVGVSTLAGHKKKGYASGCMTKLCGELLNEGKHLCLFYDNPEAGNIYKRLGFVDIGKWVMNYY